MPPHSTFVKIRFTLIHLRLCYPSGLFPPGLPHQKYAHLLSPIPTTFPAHLILPDLTTRTIFYEQKRS